MLTTRLFTLCTRILFVGHIQMILVVYTFTLRRVHLRLVLLPQGIGRSYLLPLFIPIVNHGPNHERKGCSCLDLGHTCMGTLGSKFCCDSIYNFGSLIGVLLHDLGHQQTLVQKQEKLKRERYIFCLLCW